MLIAILILQLLTGGGHRAEHYHAASERKLAAIEDPGFLGFRLGMKAAAALRHEGKDPRALNRVKVHAGQRVISDTMALASCKMPMRRSLGFDSAGLLTAVGLTYQTTPELVSTARDCAYHWLSKLYGPATETVRDSTKQEVWKFGPAQITLEARGYNARDYFVLIYYYKGTPAAN